MTYKIELTKKARKYFTSCDETLKKQFAKKVGLLQADPFNNNKLLDVEVMQGNKNAFRRRI